MLPNSGTSTSPSPTPPDNSSLQDSPPTFSTKKKSTQSAKQKSPSNNKKKEKATPNNDLRSLKQQYRSCLKSLNELFPDWRDDNLLLVMDECKGDLDTAIIRISEGKANQWGQVKKSSKHHGSSSSKFSKGKA